MTGAAWTSLIFLIGALVLVVPGLLRRRIEPRKLLAMAVVWIVIIGLAAWLFGRGGKF